MTRRFHILLISARRDRHARELLAAFEALGVEVTLAPLADIGFSTRSRHGLSIPEFGDRLPDAVCVRTMDGGTFEAVTRRLGVLHALDRLSVFVSNGAKAIEICVDKAATSFMLHQAGLPSPASLCVESRAAACDALSRAPGPMVLKPLFGSQGKGLQLITQADDLPESEALSGGVYYLQDYIGAPADDGSWSDYRVLVSSGRAVAAMRREARQWITNIKQGATAKPVRLDHEMEELALASASAVGADFCGVDLLRARDGSLQILEVNSMPAWTGLAEATGLDIAAIRASDLVARLARQGREAAFEDRDRRKDDLMDA